MTDALEEIAQQGLKYFTDESTKIPVPDPSYLKDAPEETTGSNKMVKHKKIFEKFCQWAAKPKKERRPTTEAAFEKKNSLAKGTLQQFKKRDEYQPKRIKYFWEWMMDKLPDVTLAIYERAMDKSTADARIFTEIIAKKLDTEKVEQRIQNFMLVGVPQEKINRLFTPDKYEDAEVLPKDESKDSQTSRESVQKSGFKLPKTETSIPTTESE